MIEWKRSGLAPKYDVCNTGLLRFSATHAFKIVNGTIIRVGTRRIKLAFMVAAAFVSPTEGMWVIHIDGDVTNCSANNLEVIEKWEWKAIYEEQSSAKA